MRFDVIIIPIIAVKKPPTIAPAKKLIRTSK